jgi:hypothetical protein
MLDGLVINKKEVKGLRNIINLLKFYIRFSIS